jgi:hypothetical protein
MKELVEREVATTEFSKRLLMADWAAVRVLAYFNPQRPDLKNAVACFEPSVARNDPLFVTIGGHHEDINLCFRRFSHTCDRCTYGCERLRPDSPSPHPSPLIECCWPTLKPPPSFSGI